MSFQGSLNSAPVRRPTLSGRCARRPPMSLRNRDGMLHIYPLDQTKRVQVSLRPDGNVTVKMGNHRLVLTRSQAERLVIHGRGRN